MTIPVSFSNCPYCNKTSYKYFWMNKGKNSKRKIKNSFKTKCPYCKKTYWTRPPLNTMLYTSILFENVENKKTLFVYNISNGTIKESKQQIKDYVSVFYNKKWKVKESWTKLWQSPCVIWEEGISINKILEDWID